MSTTTLDEFVQRLAAARKEIQQIRELNAQLETQCGLQKKELEALRDQRQETRSELQNIMSKVETLMRDKVQLESKLLDLKTEHQKLVSVDF